MARRRAVRWLLYLSLTAIAVVAATVMSIPLWIGPLMAWEASATLARPVTIGYLGLHFGDPVTVSAEDLVIGNPERVCSRRRALRANPAPDCPDRCGSVRYAAARSSSPRSSWCGRRSARSRPRTAGKTTA